MGAGVSMTTSTRIPAMNNSVAPSLNNNGHSTAGSSRLPLTSHFSLSQLDERHDNRVTKTMTRSRSDIVSSHNSHPRTLNRLNSIEDEHDFTRVDLDDEPVRKISSRKSSQYTTSTRKPLNNSPCEWTCLPSSKFLSADSISNSTSLSLTTYDHQENEDSTEDETSSEEELDSFSYNPSASFSSLKKMLSNDLYQSHTSRFATPVKSSKVIRSSRDELFPHDPSLSSTPPKSHHLNIGNNKYCGHFGNCEYRIIVTPPPYSPSSNASILNISSKTIEEERKERQKIILEKRRKLYYIQSLRNISAMFSPLKE
ncbi:hypothetical protein C9374_002865 [Naegleria lovaniensis]|uniref:Uncharacterized protein n=1 Tax=Naegleria lovaniensis TaxID=51637 RepID=A0AA88GVE0_NAELO|nr:uncharacterized protein C9374_002865 [Naegleria lovaniensis]KAG2386419.1 hypothetical protein C9374_002865 [Naegleria lovaniensis]